jgi:hypothetical protein
MRSIDRSPNGAEIVNKARSSLCVFVPEQKVEACGKQATHFYIFDKKWPLCYCNEHDKDKITDEENYIAPNRMEPCSKEDFDAAIFLNY